MKATLLLIVLVAIFANLSSAWLINHATDGEAITNIPTPVDDQECNYVRLTVPEGTAIVTIDVESGDDSLAYLAVSVGFNAAPAAYETNLNSNLFSDTSVYKGNAKRYFLCTYDPIATFGSYYQMPTVYTYSTTYCSAYVPDMHNGGDVYVCLSTYTTPIVNGTVTIKSQGVEANVTVTDAMTATVPAFGSSITTQGAVAWRFFVPFNTTQLQVQTSSSSTVVRTPGLWSNAYTTGNYLYNYYYQTGVWYYLVAISASSTAETLTFSTTVNCDGWFTAAISSSSSSTCYPVQNATLDTPMSTNFTGAYYKLYRVWIPETPSANILYALNVTVNTTNFAGYIYFSGLSNYGADSYVNPLGSFSAYRGSHSVGYSGNSNYAVGHFFLPGSYVNVVVESNSYSYDTTVTISAVAEPLNNFVFSVATALDESNTEITVPTETGVTLGSYFVTQKMTVAEGKAMNVTVSSDISMVGVAVTAADMMTAVATVGVGYTTATSYNIYLPYLPAGDYYITAVPFSSGSRSVTYSVIVTDSPSDSAAGVATYSLLTLFVAMLVALLF